MTLTPFYSLELAQAKMRRVANNNRTRYRRMLNSIRKWNPGRTSGVRVCVRSKRRSRVSCNLTQSVLSGTSTT